MRAHVVVAAAMLMYPARVWAVSDPCGSSQHARHHVRPAAATAAAWPYVARQMSTFRPCRLRLGHSAAVRPGARDAISAAHCPSRACGTRMSVVG